MKAIWIIGVTCLIMGLSGCGGSNADTSTENNSITKTAQTKKKSKSKKTKVKKVIEGYTLDQYLKTSVIGLKPLMTIEEVRQTLESKGFKIPARGVGIGVADASFGMGCKERNKAQRNPCRTGQMQDSAKSATRTDAESGIKEIIFPFFFFDRDGIEKLYSVKYTKPFAEPIYPENMKDTLIKRYGTPNRAEIWGDSNEQELFIKYLMHTNLPSGEAYDDVLVEKTVQTIFGEDKAMRAGKTRLDCFKRHLEDYDAVIDERCSYLMGLDAYDTHLFFEAIKDSRALNINVTSDKMVVEMIGRFIPEATRTWQREQNTRKKIKELENRRNQKTNDLSDL